MAEAFVQDVAAWFGDAKTQMQWHRDHLEIPIFVVAAYLAFVFRVPEMMSNKQAFSLKPILAIWNLSLAVFSIVGAYQVVPYLYRHLAEYGFQYDRGFTICSSPFLWSLSPGAPGGLWVGLFIYSKIPELLDTVFLILRKREVIFLHWYHHVTVLLFCWQAWHVVVGYGIWFASMNYTVHAIMYTYYFCTNVGLYPIVKHIAPLITFMQIAQMIFGMVVLLFVAYWTQTATETVTSGLDVPNTWEEGYKPNACAIDAANLKLGLAMYFSYFVLFAMFFLNKYIAKPEGKSNGHKNEKKHQ